MKLLFGHGYLGSRVAALWRAAGDDVAVVTRSPHKAGELSALGYLPIVADVARAETLRELPSADTVVYAVGFDRSNRTNQSILDVYAGGINNVLAALPAVTGRFIYISTTGVYGDAEGLWIDEETPPNPERDGGVAAWEAEQILREHRLADNSVVLRLAGIYGPGRIPFLNALARGESIAAPSDGHLNLIHVDDAARCVLAAEQKAAGPLYCVSDGHPVVRREFYFEVARRIGAPKPYFTAPDPSSRRATRAASDKRVCNNRLLAELRVSLRYPTYRDGLAAFLLRPGNA
jgi:nucleoside-diphosphate-sugar epimerase